MYEEKYFRNQYFFSFVVALWIVQKLSRSSSFTFCCKGIEKGLILFSLFIFLLFSFSLSAASSLTALIWDGLAGSSSLRVLKLRNQLTNELDFSRLSALLKVTKSLKYLDISGEAMISMEGIKALRRAFRINRSVTDFVGPDEGLLLYTQRIAKRIIVEEEKVESLRREIHGSFQKYFDAENENWKEIPRQETKPLQLKKKRAKQEINRSVFVSLVSPI